MVGRDVVLKMEKEDPKNGKVLVDVKNLVVADQGGRRLIDDMSFSIREGEVVGIAGVEGNGQSRAF